MRDLPDPLSPTPPPGLADPTDSGEPTDRRGPAALREDAAPDAAALETLVAEVQAARRYRDVAPELVRRLGRAALAASADRRTALKVTKRRLHQAVGAFASPPPYPRLQAALEAAYAAGDPAAIRAACRDALAGHASTRERLPILPDLYARVFAVTGPPASLLDLGCGLAPLALPWMPLPADAPYRACDVDQATVDFVNRFLRLAGRPPLAERRDVLARPPEEPADVALLLKLLPTLERQEPGGGLRLLDALPVRCAVVSFPVRSLGGRDKGMPQSYDRELRATLGARPWPVERLAFAGELVYVVFKESR